jgi:hypothetical protein
MYQLNLVIEIVSQVFWKVMKSFKNNLGLLDQVNKKKEFEIRSRRQKSYKKNGKTFNPF